MRKNNRGEIATSTRLLIAGGALRLGWLAPKPKIFDSRSRDAAALGPTDWGCSNHARRPPAAA